MPTTLNAITTPSSPDAADYEPDEAWKKQLKKRIEDSLESMVSDAQESQAAERRKAPDTPETRLRLEADCNRAMQTISALASEQYQLELDRERNQRRWAAGMPMNPAWTQYFHQEQQNIMNSIKQSTTTTTTANHSVRSAAAANNSTESPSEERRSAATISNPSNDPSAFASPHPVLQPVPPNPSPRPTDERERSFRRGSDARATAPSHDRDEHHPASGSFRRGHHAQRPTLPEHWVSTDTVEEPDDLLRSPSSHQPRARLSSIDRPSQSSPVSPGWDSSLGRSSGSMHSVDRHMARSPPEVRKPPPENTLPSKMFNLPRRGSVTSMRSSGSGTSMRSTGSGTSLRSSGSGAGIRPSIRETIPERVDDDDVRDESPIDENDYERFQQESSDQASTRITKEKRPHRRRNSRQSSVDATPRSDELGSSSLRSASSSSTMQYATLPNGHLSSKSSSASVNDDHRHHHPNDSPGNPPPGYCEYRDQTSSRDNYPRDPPQDQQRSIPQRSSYGGGDDRDYGPPPTSSHRSHVPKPPYHPQREPQPISRQQSFTLPSHVVDMDDDGDDEREFDRAARDRWERDYDRDRDAYPEPPREPPRRATTYPYPTPRHAPYPPPPSASRQDYNNDFHDDRLEGPPGPGHGRYPYRNLPPDDYEYHGPPEGGRPAPSRRSSYVRRDDDNRRSVGENDGYTRHYNPPVGPVPIPRHTTSLDEPQPAWREWAAESNRHPNYDYHQPTRDSPNVESFPHRRFTQPTQPPPSYHNSPHDEQLNFGGRETDLSHRVNSAVTDEYESEEDTEPEDEEEGIDDNDSFEDELEDEIEDGDKAKKSRLRDLRAKAQMLQANKKQADDELLKTELEIKQLANEEAKRKKEEEDKRSEQERAEQETRRREEEARKKEEEVRRKEHELKKKEEEAARKEAEAKRMAEDARKKAMEASKKEREARRKEQEAKRKEEAAKRTEDEAKRKAEEVNRKEEETRQRAAQLQEDTETTKRLQLEAEKFAEDLRKMEEEMKEREETLRRREAALALREADNLRKEQETMEKELEGMKKKQEAMQKEAAVRKEKARRAEEAKESREREAARVKEAARQKEDAKQRQARLEAEAERQAEEIRKEEARKKEEAQQKQLEAKRKADAKKEEENEKRKLQQAEEEKQREENARRQEAMLENLREHEKKRLQNESLDFNDMDFDDLHPDQVDPELMRTQLQVLQEAKFRKREEGIRLSREERKRNDSVGNESARPNPPHLSSSPGTSPGMSRTPPQFNSPPVAERSAGSSNWATGSGPAPTWGSSIKPTPSPSPAAANWSSAGASTGKSRTSSFSSGTFPTSSSPHTASFSEAERARKQQEFAESQQEQFRRAQEKFETERQLKSAGRPLSREELQRVFEHHERLWNRLSTLSELSWNDFPWPMSKPPSNPDNLSLPLISAYMQSPLHADKDKSRTPKDRIKEHIKRWHPDRFETKLLPKVAENEREKVKLGAGNVARYLSDLLRKENDSNNNIFGD